MWRNNGVDVAVHSCSFFFGGGRVFALGFWSNTGKYYYVVVDFFFSYLALEYLYWASSTYRLVLTHEDVLESVEVKYQHIVLKTEKRGKLFSYPDQFI